MACARTEDAKSLFSTIPQEIIDAAIDLLEGDPKSLQAASLVQKSCYHRTREHLFREIIFRGRNIEARSVKLKNLFEDNPPLVQCIEELTLTNPALSDLAQVIAIVPLLTSLAGFTMKNIYYFDWASLSDELVASLLELMANPRMQKVALINVKNFHIAPLTQFHNLKELVLSNVHLPFESSRSSATSLGPRAPLQVPPSPDNRLQTLYINGCEELLKTLIASAKVADGTLDIFHPTTLKLGTMHFGQMKETWAVLLERCGPTLENYEVLHDSDWFPSQAFALRCFPKLKYFNMAHYYFHFKAQNPLFILLEELDCLSQSDAPRNLSKIRLGFDFREFDGRNEDFDIDKGMQRLADFDFWTKLDGFLAKPAFLRLKTLIIAFNTTDCGLSNAVWEEVRTKILSNLHTRPGIVNVLKWAHDF